MHHYHKSLLTAKCYYISLNPESTIETFNRQFQLGKIEKEAVEWAWPLEAGDTMFNVVNTYTRAAQFEGLTAEASHRLQRVGGNILGMLR